MSDVVPSICRLCSNTCSILVEVADGRAVRVTGDPDGPAHFGYSCVKGRALPQIHAAPDRLLTSMKRTPAGEYELIESERALDEIAERLAPILERHGPRSLALYVGTSFTHSPPASPMANAFMDALGAPMRFTANTIDSPGKSIAKGLHGTWMAPAQGFDEPEVMLYVGVNGLVSYAGFPGTDPGRYLKDAARRGAKIIVVDPRRSDLAKRAFLHVQPRPGQDIAILAGMIRFILDEELHDTEFVAENVSGVDALRRAVDRFTPALVAERADIAASDLVMAARTFAQARRGYAVGGTGGNMGNAQGTLFEYLIMTIDTLCGHWLRAGEVVRNPGTLVPTFPHTAQASPPKPSHSFGERIRVRNLSNSLAGLPTSALAEEILTRGEGQVRALICVGGNPVAAWPDQLQTIAAMQKLELLVTVDVRMSQTARLAHYVLAPTMMLEVPGSSLQLDNAAYYANAYKSFQDAAGQYTPAVAERPAGSDLIEEWELFYGLARRLGVPLVLGGKPDFLGPGIPATPIDLENKPTTDDLLDVLTTGSRIPLSEVKKRPHGARFPDPTMRVKPKEPGWEGRLDVGNCDMMRDLEATGTVDDIGAPISAGFPFRLLSRRMQHVVNSAHNIPTTNRGRKYNPAFVNPDDLAELGFADGAVVEIASELTAIRAVVLGDKNLRRGLVSMTHCYGGSPDEDDQVLEVGSPVNRLVSVDRVYERYSGQPLMSNVPVAIRAIPANEQ